MNYFSYLRCEEILIENARFPYVILRLPGDFIFNLKLIY